MNRRKSREQAFQLIFARSLSHDGIRQIIDTAEMSEDVRIEEFAEKTACGVEENEALLDGEIKKYIRGWTLDRLSKVSLALLRLALYEMKFAADIPVGVSINEAVDLAKKYGTASDAPFVNGVLGSAAREMEQKHA
ncbi:MAG TPA: transcription antitermination factor NusB [Ruminococcaceae bacterium]|jgi:N utilization substance protein B|nr:transcription antitermination factor NusB [Oscillospiraceae bacterium]HBG55148.1 transcription antitermination factor NusB [Oscillospiraceae bacterium]HBQ45675.1 transcription antitermination factor NusB [Oscillospiraceae bacterium]HBT90610.1 transcription antitermination factor NusB [Oscillospiraceae bacterium]HCB91075.1 transcription antitermination factor NusB [Oscillospiraceae bacterium]